MGCSVLLGYHLSALNLRSFLVILPRKDELPSFSVSLLTLVKLFIPTLKGYSDKTSALGVFIEARAIELMIWV